MVHPLVNVDIFYPEESMLHDLDDASSELFLAEHLDSDIRERIPTISTDPSVFWPLLKRFLDIVIRGGQTEYLASTMSDLLPVSAQ